MPKGLPEHMRGYGRNAELAKKDEKKKRTQKPRPKGKKADSRSARVDYTPPKSTPESRKRRAAAKEKAWRKRNPAGAAAMDIKKTVDKRKSLVGKFLGLLGLKPKKKK